MSDRLFVFSLSLAVGLAGCCKSSKTPPKKDPELPPPQAPIALGAEPAWPLPDDLPDDASVERLRDRTPGTSGAFVLGEIPDVETPVRGAVVPWHDGSPRFHPHNPLSATSLGSGDWLLVLARSGLWLVEAGTLAVRARLVKSVYGDVAASPDGSRFAYGRCENKQCFVDIRSFPSLTLVWSAPMDAPHRIRFSPSGSHLAVASASRDSATVVDVENRSVHLLRARNDVNDALILSVDKQLVAYGTDSNVGVIRNWVTQEIVYDTQAAMRARKPRGFDQNATAYDPVRDDWYVGGNDDVVWRFGGVKTGAPYYKGHMGFANDVEDLAILSNGDVLVGLDSGSIDLWRVSSDESRKPALGASVGLISWGARLNLDAKGNVLAVLGGTVIRWKPGDDLVAQASFFGSAVNWKQSYTTEDVVLWSSTKESSSSHVFQRAPLKASDPLTVVARPIGTIEIENQTPDVRVLKDGTRLILGEGPDQRLRVYRLPPGGALSAPEDSAIPYEFMGKFVTADDTRIGYQARRVAAEIDGAGARQLATLSESERLVWNPKKGRWEVCSWEPGFARCRTLP